MSERSPVAYRYGPNYRHLHCIDTTPSTHHVAWLYEEDMHDGEPCECGCERTWNGPLAMWGYGVITSSTFTVLGEVMFYNDPEPVDIVPRDEVDDCRLVCDKRLGDVYPVDRAAARKAGVTHYLLYATPSGNVVAVACTIPHEYLTADQKGES